MFDIKKNKRAVSVDRSVDSTTSELQEDTTSKTVVATQSWVGKVLDRVWAWADKFKTNELQVTGVVESKGVTTETIVSDSISTKRITLLDSAGKPMILSVGEDGSLSVKYDLECVYLYSGVEGVTTKSFYYIPGLTIQQNFEDTTPFKTMTRFVPFNSNEFAMYGTTKCNKLCIADGKDEYVDKTLLFTCNGSKKIAGITIMDENLVQIMDRIDVPGGQPVSKLTINMPQFYVNGELTTIELPQHDVVDCYADMPWMPSPLMMIPPPPPPFMNPSPLSTDIFDDDPFEDRESSRSVEGTEIPTGPIYQDYTTSTYSNIALKKSVFPANTKLFVKVDTVNA